MQQNRRTSRYFFFSALSNDVGHVLQLFTFSDVAAVDDRSQGSTLVKAVTGSVTGGRAFIILTRFMPVPVLRTGSHRSGFKHQSGPSHTRVALLL
jgi:hypothetical protein